MIMRNLWWCSNGFIHEKTFLSSNQIVGISEIQLETFQTAAISLTVKVKKTDPSSTTSRWVKPKLNQVKCNWDALVKVPQKITSFGGLIRDSKGMVLASFYNTYFVPLIPVIDKAMALIQVLTICQDLGLHVVQFVGDCLHLIQNC